MKDYLDKVKFSFLFNGISSRELELALDCLKAEDMHFPKGMVIVKEGELCERFGLLISGQLQSTQYDFQGNRSIIQTIEPLQIFNENYCFVHEKSPVNIETVEDSHVLFLKSDIQGSTFPPSCSFHKRLLNNLFIIQTHKNVELTQKLECMSKRTTREKLMTFLKLESLKQGSKEFDIRLDRQQLADYLGIERSAMSAELSRMVKDGHIRTRKFHFEILNR